MTSLFYPLYLPYLLIKHQNPVIYPNFLQTTLRLIPTYQTG